MDKNEMHSVAAFSGESDEITVTKDSPTKSKGNHRKKKAKENSTLMLKKREQRKEKNLERIQKLRLMDDLLMTRVFDDRDKDVTSYILKIILEKKNLEVKEVHSQRTISN